MGLLQLRSCAETRAHTSLCSSQQCSTQENSSSGNSSLHVPLPSSQPQTQPAPGHFSQHKPAVPGTHLPPRPWLQTLHRAPGARAAHAASPAQDQPARDRFGFALASLEEEPGTSSSDARCARHPLSHFWGHQDSHPHLPICRAPCQPKLPKTKFLCFFFFLLSFGILQQNTQILPEIRKIHHVHTDR